MQRAKFWLCVVCCYFFIVSLWGKVVGKLTPKLVSSKDWFGFLSIAAIWDMRAFCVWHGWTMEICMIIWWGKKPNYLLHKCNPTKTIKMDSCVLEEQKGIVKNLVYWMLMNGCYSSTRSGFWQRLSFMVKVLGIETEIKGLERKRYCSHLPLLESGFLVSFVAVSHLTWGSSTE